jgi:hypothetical protein
MKTKALIEMILKEAPDFSVPQIIEFLNEVQNILLRRRIPFMQVFEETTGQPPVVFVDDTTRKYSIPDIWFIGDVTTYSGQQLPVLVYPSTENTDAYFLLRNDYVGYVNVEAYKKPIRITSATTELTVPPEYHLNVVKEGVMAYIEQAEYGNSARMEKFERVLIPRFIGGVSYVDTNEEVYFRKAYS